MNPLPESLKLEFLSESKLATGILSLGASAPVKWTKATLDCGFQRLPVFLPSSLIRRRDEESGNLAKNF